MVTKKEWAELDAKLGAWLEWRDKKTAPAPHGCVCPVGAEQTCKGWECPRRAPDFRVT